MTTAESPTVTKLRMFRMLADREIGGTLYAREGDIVYDCHQVDYGCANDDTRWTGQEHRSVTLDPTGDYPFFTVPVRDLQEITE